MCTQRFIGPMDTRLLDADLSGAEGPTDGDTRLFSTIAQLACEHGPKRAFGWFCGLVSQDALHQNSRFGPAIMEQTGRWRRPRIDRVRSAGRSSRQQPTGCVAVVDSDLLRVRLLPFAFGRPPRQVLTYHHHASCRALRFQRHGEWTMVDSQSADVAAGKSKLTFDLRGAAEYSP